MTENRKLHPKHIYRNMNPFVPPRIRQEDVPNYKDFKWHKGTETRSIWCEDPKTGNTLFVIPPPRTMREAVLVGYMAGKAAGYKEYDRYGELLIEDLFAEDLAHYQLYGYYPDEEPMIPPIAPMVTEADYLAAQSNIDDADIVNEDSTLLSDDCSETTASDKISA